MSTCPHRAKTHYSDSACTPKWNSSSFWFGHSGLLKMEAEHFQERRNKRTEEREVWSWVHGKQHSMFCLRSGFPLKTRKKTIIHHRLSAWKDQIGLSSRIIWSSLSWQQHKLDKVAQDPGQLNLESVQLGEISTSVGWVNTVQSANSFETFTLLSKYYLRQPGQISLLFKL